MPSRPPAPRPRPSAAVYRRRRLVVSVLAAVVLLLVGWGIGALVNRAMGAAGSGAETTPSASPTPVSSPTPAAASGSQGAAEASVDPASLEECAPMDLRLVAATDKDAYAPGEEAELRLDVTNLSGRPCRADVGTAMQEFRLEDAAGEQVMSTRVCQADPTHQEAVLQPREQQSAVYRWSGRASSADCAKAGAELKPGAYRFTVTLGEVTSRPVTLEVRGSSSGATPAAPAVPSPSPSPTGSASVTPGPASSAASSTGSTAPASPSPARG